MAQKSKLMTQLSDFLNLYTLIFGAIMVILGFQFVILGLAFNALFAVCLALPLLLFGGFLVWWMLQDKVYHRVFYRPAYPSYYDQASTQQQSYNQQSSYQPSHNYPTSPPPTPGPSYYGPQQQFHPQSSPQHQSQSSPQYQPQSSPQHQSQSSSAQAVPSQSPYQTPPSMNSDQPGYEGSRTQDTREEEYGPLYSHHRSEPLSSDPFPSYDSMEPPRSEEPYSSSFPYDEEDGIREPYGTGEEPMAQDGPSPSTDPYAYPREPSGDIDSQRPSQSGGRSYGSDPHYGGNTTRSPYGGAPSYQQPPGPSQYPYPQPPQYLPPYYSGYGQPYGSPYYGVPYITYVQYFRETLSIPQIRSLLVIFIISIIGGSTVLLLGEPYIFMFPVFFIIAFTFPSFIWISYVYHKDILEPESKHGIFIALSWGMFSTIFALFPNSVAAYYSLVFAAVVVAPLGEEFFKPLGIRRVRSEINSELDGLIYGVSCGMGFAIIENFTYELTFLFSGDSPIEIWALGSFIRGIGSTIIHAVGAGLIGFTYARLKIMKRQARYLQQPIRASLYNLSLPMAYVVAVLIHAAWNGSASIPEFLDTTEGLYLSLFGHILTFLVAFHIIKSLANEGIRRDVERHSGNAYKNRINRPAQQ